MAGSASNWYRPTKGPHAGKSIYIPKQHQGQTIFGYFERASRKVILDGLNKGMSWTDELIAVSATHRPAAAARTGASASVDQQEAEKASGQTTGTPARLAPVLNQATSSVVIGGQTRRALDSNGSLVIVQDDNNNYTVADIHSGKTFQESASLDLAREAMNNQARIHSESHVAKHLDADGRATGTIRAERLPKPGTFENTLDDIHALGPGVGKAARRVAREGWEHASNNNGDRGDPFMAALQQANGFDTLPAKVSERELQAMYDRGELTHTMSRGAGGYEADVADGALFSAGGDSRAWGAGMYTASRGSTDRERKKADAYADNFSGPDFKLAVMGLRKDARVVDTHTLSLERDKFLSRERRNLQQTDPAFREKNAVLKMFTKDLGYFGAAMGYDALIADYSNQGFDTGIVVYNRSAIVSQDTLHDMS